MPATPRFCVRKKADKPDVIIVALCYNFQSFSNSGKNGQTVKRFNGPMQTAVERLIEAIGYPEKAPEGALSFTLLVDGGEIFAEETAGRLRLVCRLTDDEALLPSLACYAPGRMLREPAILAYGQKSKVEGQRSMADSAAFLWQDAPADIDGHGLMRLFETFANSCDWWRERIGQGSGGGESAEPEPETMMILP